MNLIILLHLNKKCNTNSESGDFKFSKMKFLFIHLALDIHYISASNSISLIKNNVPFYKPVIKQSRCIIVRNNLYCIILKL